MIRIDRDAFEEWRAHPMTELLFRMLGKEAERMRDTWSSRSFDGGECDPLVLTRLRERASVMREVRDITAEQIEESLNED